MRAIIKSYILITIALMISVQCMSTNTNTLSRSYVNGNFEVTGEFMQWHKVTITLDGPNAKETDSEPNPFTDYNFTVTFTHESGSSVYVVPGYFAADGDAANTSAQSGNKWRAYLVPDKAGMWNYSISFTKGKNVAVGERGEKLKPFDGITGSFKVTKTDKRGRDFRSKGRLEYVGEHYLRFAGNGEYFLKCGADAPENFLSYCDFDGDFKTDGHKDNLIKDWQPHIRDWQPGDPTWQNGKGKGIIGAVNYLAGKGVNSVSFLTMNILGDDQNVFPYLTYDEFTHLDVSRLDQWEVVFNHAQNKGIFLHFKTQEDENQGLLDNGDVGTQRKLYYRELIARFGHHLALNWNMGEENGPWGKRRIANPITTRQQTPQRLAMAEYFYQNDPYHHHVVVHNGLQFDDILGPKARYSGVSVQCSYSEAHQKVLSWLVKSDKAGKPWAVANDEQNPPGMGVPTDPGYKGQNGQAIQDGKSYTMHDVRKFTLWGVLMAGGWGVEYYFGGLLPESDKDCQDYRSRDKSWDYGRIALEFFSENKIPFWEMQNANSVIGNTINDNSKYCLAKKGKVYLIYLPNGGSTKLDLNKVKGEFQVQWFNPRTGGSLKTGSVTSLQGSGEAYLGNPPTEESQDWLIIVRLK